MRNAMLALCCTLLLAGTAPAQQGGRPSSSESARRAALSQAVAAFMKAEGVSSPRPYLRALTDLNNDGRPDGVVLLMGPEFCGSGGCTLVVFAGQRSGFRPMSRTTLVNAPVRVATSTTRGWKNLLVETGGGGAAPATRVLRFNAPRYAGNASTQRKATVGEIRSATTVITESDGAAAETEVPIRRQWQGRFPVAALRRLPRGQQESAVGYLPDARSLEAVWKAWKPNEPVPTVDFARDLVLFARNTRFLNTLRVGRVTRTNSTVSVRTMETRTALPITTEVFLAIVTVPRSGITRVDTGAGTTLPVRSATP